LLPKVCSLRFTSLIILKIYSIDYFVLSNNGSSQMVTLKRGRPHCLLLEETALALMIQTKQQAIKPNTSSRQMNLTRQTPVDTNEEPDLHFTDKL
jgi:hypothetical protein